MTRSFTVTIQCATPAEVARVEASIRAAEAIRAFDSAIASAPSSYVFTASRVRAALREGLKERGVTPEEFGLKPVIIEPNERS